MYDNSSTKGRDSPMNKEEMKKVQAAEQIASDPTVDERRIDLAAAAILEKYRAAFEELAK
jgi:hypothetical protein